MSNFIIYDSTGFIIRTGNCPETMIELQKQENEFILEGKADIYNDYIVSNTITARPAQLTTLDTTILIANGVDVIAITNAPEGTFIATNAATHETVSGTINGTDTFATTISGTYKIKIESFPYLPFETTITAV